MATVTPKLLFCNITYSQIPVWEIVSANGKCIYYERLHRTGFRPLGILDTVYVGGSAVDVCDAVRQQGNNKIFVLKEKDGYCAPMSWYERDPNSQAPPGLSEPEPDNNYDYEEPIFDDDSDGSS